MRKCMLLAAAILALAAVACGCGPQTSEAELSKTVYSEFGELAFLVPDNWEADYSRNTDVLVLTISDNISAYAQVYYLGFDEDYATLDDFLDERLELYGDDILGDTETIEIDGMAAKKFEYIYKDYNENFEEALFHGFEYLIQAPEGVVYIDIYHTLVNPASDTQDVSSKQARHLLERVAQSMHIGNGSQTTDVPDDAEFLPIEPDND